MQKLAIIGAGLSGLSLANLLKDKYQITIFEKARGVSGRMSTRRSEPYFFDHGAQYFTARTDEFQKFLKPMLENGLVKRWDARYVKFDHDEIIERKNWQDDEPRYVGVPAMNSISKHLAVGFDTRIKVRITDISKTDKWQLKDEEGNIYNGFDWVISTAPSHQTKDLMPADFKFTKIVNEIQMTESFSVMLGFKESFKLDFDAAHLINSDLSWIAVNSSKPERNEHFTLMINSSYEYARDNIDGDREVALEHLVNEASRILNIDLTHAEYKTIHGWRYANNLKRDDYEVLVDHENQLGACGDWCHGGRVEGAFTAAYNMAQALS